MKNQKRVVIGVGRPRCGKKTHLEYLSSITGAPYIDMGAHLRALKASGSENPALQSLKDTGLSPDAFVIKELKGWLVGKLKSPLLILDGVPRNIAQTKTICAFMKHQGFKVTTIWFETPASVCLSRDARDGREDDSPEKAIKRMKDFAEFTEPMKALLKHKSSVWISVDNSELSIGEVRTYLLRNLKLTQPQAVAA